MSLLGKLKSPGPSGFGYGSTADEVTRGVDLAGKTVLVTGCNSGLGLETIRVLGDRGAHVVGLARTRDKADDALRRAGIDEGTPVACDLSEPASVRAAVDAVRALDRRLDGVICNAGIMALPKLEVKHGLELQFLTNHVGHFLLVTGLLDQVPRDGRIAVVSSAAHTGAPPEGIDFDNLDGRQGYGAWLAYGRSKLANLLFARHLAKRLGPDGPRVNALHPGVIKTNLGRHLPSAASVLFAAAGPLFLKSIPEGAATQCYLAAHPDAGRVTGEYFADCNVARSSFQGRDMALAQRLWDETERLVAGFDAG